MEIKKEFIPLILSGEREYEYTILHNDFLNDYEGVYKINDDYYFLIFFDSKINFSSLLDHCKYKNDFESLKFLISQGWYKKDFLPKGNSFVIYKWKKIKKQELEILE